VIEASPASFVSSPWTQAVLALLSALGFILSIAGLVLTVKLAPRRANERPGIGRALHTIRFWRPSQYSLAMGHLQMFRERLADDAYHKGHERGKVTESDLIRWIIQLALTCAAEMVPQSLGKANLFRVSQIVSDDTGHTTEIRLYSSEFVGVFSAHQLTNLMNETEIRHLYYCERQRPDEFPAALQCLVKGSPIVQSLRKRRASFDQPERSLGATHILAIPLSRSFHSVRELDQVVSITVDLHYSRLGGWLLDRTDIQRMSIFRRAMNLREILVDIPQLRDPRFLPLWDRSKRVPRQPTTSPEPDASEKHK
jgi:hypothetical protein